MLHALKHNADLDGLLALPAFAHADAELIEAALSEAGRLAEDRLAPLYVTGDRQGARFEAGRVTLPDGFSQAYREFAAGGWNGLPFAEAHGGQGLPWALAVAVAEIVHGANTGFGLCPLLSQSLIEALIGHGSERQRMRVLPKLIAGTWTGTMCLTEPQAGTDVGAVRTRAEPDGDAYRLFGQKIYITYGEHDLAENIVHLVLARLPDAAPGTKGLSLFLVPKYRINDDGALGARNDVRCLSIEHKLGIHASPTCVLSFGDDGGGAYGELVGEAHDGMRAMFTMMNNARVMVGVEGVGIAERAWQHALVHARERIQGRIRGQPAAIIRHRDVQRMLATMQALVQASRALALYAASQIDLSVQATGADARAYASRRLALLTPMVKAWCTDCAVRVADLGLQVHGGMGYVEETGAAQIFRDARITPIYEGTNGVQAMDLAGRKLDLAGGLAFDELLGDLRAWRDAIDRQAPDLAAGLQPALEALSSAVVFLRETADGDQRAAAATPFLQLAAMTIAGSLLARQAVARDASPGLIGSARFFICQLLPSASAQLGAVVAPADGLSAALADVLGD